MNELQFKGNVKVRFAPSPTGHLHIGGLRTALFNYFFAKKNKGSYVLRIEDTDVARSTDVFKQSIIDSFEWIGIVPDEPIVVQSERFKEHMAVVDMLLKQKKAYRCYCTQEVLLQRLGKSEESFVRYDRYCYNKQNRVDILDLPFVIRFLMPVDEPDLYSFNDIIRDKITFQPDHFDDFIIVRSDGVPVYNFVVVVDDAYMGITHVIRGEEHIPNTPKQIALYKACGYNIPHFAHLPMILGPEGHKLSKRDGAKSVYEYKNEGYLPDALINYLMRLGWSCGDQEIFTKSELENLFTLESVNKKGAIFDQAKLDWMNTQYLKKMSAEDIFSYIIQYIDSNFSLNYSCPHEKVLRVIELFKGRVTTIGDLIIVVNNVSKGFDIQLLNEHKSLFTQDVCNALHSVSEALNHDLLNQDMLKKIAHEHNCQPMILMQSLRLILIGQLMGPGIFDLIGIMGKKEALDRVIKSVITVLQ